LSWRIYGYVDIKYLQPRRPVAEVGDVAISAQAWQARVRMERRRLISEVQLYQQYQEYLGVDLSAQQQNILTQLNAVSPIGQSVLGDMVDEEIIRQEAAAASRSGAGVEAAIQASFRFSAGHARRHHPSPVAPPTLSANPCTGHHHADRDCLSDAPRVSHSPRRCADHSDRDGQGFNDTNSSSDDHAVAHGHAADAGWIR
jgi:hypothetical protein